MKLRRTSKVELAYRVDGEKSTVPSRKVDQTLLGAEVVHFTPKDGQQREWTILGKPVKVRAEDGSDRLFLAYDAGELLTRDGTKIPLVAFGFQGQWSGKAKQVSTDTFRALAAYFGANKIE